VTGRLKWHRNHQFTVCINSFLSWKLKSLEGNYATLSRDYSALLRDNSSLSRHYAALSREHTSLLFTVATSCELCIVKKRRFFARFFRQSLNKKSFLGEKKRESKDGDNKSRVKGRKGERGKR